MTKSNVKKTKPNKANFTLRSTHAKRAAAIFNPHGSGGYFPSTNYEPPTTNFSKNKPNFPYPLSLVILACLLVSLLTAAAKSSQLSVTSPPAEVVERLNLSPFYKKHVNLRGFSIVSSQKVSDYALLEAAYLIDKLLSDRQDILDALTANKVRLAVMSYAELTTQIPEHSDLKPGKFWDRRARGLGPTRSRPAVSCGEENLLCYPGDPYSTENILIHEFAHAMHHMGLNYIDETFDKRLKAAYDDAMEKGLWKDKYAGSNRAEYWAEAVQSYFNDNREPDHDHNHVNTRKELFEYDPALAKIVQEVFGDKDWEYKKPAQRNAQDRKHLTGYDANNAPSFAWPAELLKWYKNYEAEKNKG